METMNIHDEGAVRVVQLDRPEALNAFNGMLMDELAQTFLDATADDSVHVIVLTGAGRAFSAGADLMEMGRATHEPFHGFGGLQEAILEFPKPFIVAINGLGVGIGATITGLADLVFIAEGARLRCPFSALGLTAEAASTFTFPKLMGRQRASWFLLSAEWMSAEECVEAGIALEMFSAEDLMPRVMEQAQKLAALPMESLKTTKALIMDPLRDQMRATIKAETEGLARLVGGPANQEAVSAFRERREANFSAL
jgi:enoyl-CoA hydratase/carnithine racemase